MWLADTEIDAGSTAVAARNGADHNLSGCRVTERASKVWACEVVRR